MPFKQADLVRIEALMKKWHQEDPAGFDEAVNRVEGTSTSIIGNENVSGNGVLPPLSASSPIGGVHAAKEDSVGYGKEKGSDPKKPSNKDFEEIIDQLFKEYDDVYKALA